MHDEVTRSIPEDQLSSIIRDRNLNTKDAKLQAIANLLQQTVSKRQATYGTSAQETCSALHALGMVQLERCDWAASIATDRRLLAAIEARDGPDTALAARYNLALTLSKDGQYVEAEEILRRLLPIEREKIGRNNPQALGCLRDLIEVLAAQGKGEEARELLREGWMLVGEMEENDPEKKEEIEAVSGVEAGLEGRRE
jgi:tetratricopeptide (TPR) repeat protein